MNRPTRVTFANSINDHAQAPDGWGALLITKEEIDGQIARLLEGSMPESGSRSASIVHPEARDGVPSLTPVTEVLISVLKPGETEIERRGNYSLLETSIAGKGTVLAGKSFEADVHDVWTVPPMQPHTYANTGDVPWARLTYSNAPLLKRSGTFYTEFGPFERDERADDEVTDEKKAAYNREKGFDLKSPETGSRLRSYEYLTDIEVVEDPAQHWAWSDIKTHLPLRRGDNNDPSKRTIWLLYNPATGRKQGTTQTHFATYSGFGPDTPTYKGDSGHRHISASINYHIQGYGYSVVDGVRIDWKAGDLLFSAPSWSEHAHYGNEGGRVVLTVQDHPMHIGLGSLLWQESMKGPIISLGNEAGQKGFVGPRKVGD